MDQVAAVEDRNTGKILERRIDQVKVTAYAADGRIGIKTGDDRVTERHRTCPISEQRWSQFTFDQRWLILFLR
jgi:hypothetical protein